MTIRIATDFTETPGARHRNAGNCSGEEFREAILEPKFLEANGKGEKLIIDLDGGYGYPTSFLDEAFGGLSRKYGADNVLSALVFVSRDEPSLPNEIKGYIASDNGIKQH